MKITRTIRSFEQIKILADARRLQLLRLLMAAPSTLTQLAAAVGHTPAWVKHHLTVLENAGLVELLEVRTHGTVTEKFYASRAAAWLLQEIIFPSGDSTVFLFAGSHDLALELIAEHLAPGIDLLIQPVGSLDGLATLRLGFCHLAGTHLLDVSGVYNVPYIRQLFPEGLVSLMTLAHRQQGLMFAPGNPKGIHSLQDISRQDISFIIRNRGSGTRVWVDTQLQGLGIPVKTIHAYPREVSTHSEAAGIIERGQADATIGLQAAAVAHHLEFIPLFTERYDLAIPAGQLERLAPLLEYIQSAAFRTEVGSLAGYDSTHSGEWVM